MLKDGAYVRMVIAPQTRRGTIHRAINDKGEQQFLFRLDHRFRDDLPDYFIYDGDVEECLRPSDEEVAAAKKLVGMAS